MMDRCFRKGALNILAMTIFRRSPSLCCVPIVMLTLLYSLIVPSRCAFGAEPETHAPNAAVESISTRDHLVRGLLCAAKGDYQSALEAYGVVLAREPHAGAASYASAQAWIGLDQLDSARHYSSIAVESDPSNKYYRGMLAAIYHEQKSYKLAAREFQKLSELDPSSISVLYSLAQSYLSAGEDGKALKVYLRILRFDPADERTLSRILWLELKLHQYREAIATLRSLIRQVPDNQKLRLTLGELYLQINEPQKAIEIFEALARDHPAFLPAWVDLLGIRAEQGDPLRFQECLNRYYLLDHVTLNQKIELARLFMIRSELDGIYTAPALVMLERIASEEPDNLNVLLMRAMLYSRQERYQEAREGLTRVLELDPLKVHAWEELASSYMAGNQYHHVLYTIRKAREVLNPLTLRLQVLDGYALFRSGLYQKASRVLNDALGFVNKESRQWLLIQLHMTRAMNYEKLMDMDKSRQAYIAVLDIDPENPLALNNLAYMMAEGGGDLDKALEYALKAVAEEPDNPVFLDTLGWVYAQRGEYDNAKGYLEKAVQQKPDEPEIYQHLSEVYKALGDEEKAEAYRQKGREVEGQ